MCVTRDVLARAHIYLRAAADNKAYDAICPAYLLRSRCIYVRYVSLYLFAYCLAYLATSMNLMIYMTVLLDTSSMSTHFKIKII